MTKIIIFVDPERCIGCYACVIACKMEHNLPPYPASPPVAEPKGLRLIRVFQVGPEIKNDKVYQYFVPVSCMHCDDPPCMYSCPVKAISKGEDGVVRVDREKCTGCKMCFWACPYRAPQFTSEGKMIICDLCIDNLQSGRKAACEANCPTKCIYIGTPNEIYAQVGQRFISKLRKFYELLMKLHDLLHLQ